MKRYNDHIEFTLIVAAIFAAVCAFLLSGCMDTSPAARSNRNETHVTFEFGNRNVVRVSVGDGLYASADAKDTSESTTGTPSLSVPTSVTVPAGAASPLTAGIQEAGATAREGIKAMSKSGAGHDGPAPQDKAPQDNGGCENGECATPGGAK